jgi:hypothetical protein
MPEGYSLLYPTRHSNHIKHLQAGWFLIGARGNGFSVQAEDVQYHRLNDGRKLCLECRDTAVLDTKACQPLYREVLKFYKNQGMKIDQEIPMLLVERTALNAARESEKDGHAHTAETRGLCLSEEQTISTVSSILIPVILLVKAVATRLVHG